MHILTKRPHIDVKYISKVFAKCSSCKESSHSLSLVGDYTERSGAPPPKPWKIAYFSDQCFSLQIIYVMRHLGEVKIKFKKAKIKTQGRIQNFLHLWDTEIINEKGLLAVLIDLVSGMKMMPLVILTSKWTAYKIYHYWKK